MSSCSVQFHALNEELFAFIEKLRTDNELFIFCSDDLRLREYSIINTDSKVEITKNRRIFFLRRIIDVIHFESRQWKYSERKGAG